MMIEYDNGIRIEPLNVNLDATRKCDYSFVSHAHSDHARKHRKILATPETALLYRYRFPSVPARVIPYGRKARIGSATVELFPSGHMLGAAQILVITKGTRIVYTGDFKTYPNLTCVPVEIRRCDILIMESTYGDPICSFPPQNEVYARIIMFIERCFADGNTPVLVGYATGKAQEVVFLIQQHGFPVHVDSKVAEINELYRSAGVKLKPTRHFTERSSAQRVLVVTPQTLRTEPYKALPYKRSVFLSGWSQGGNAKRFCVADWSLPLSDHADFNGLLSYVDKCRPKKIYTLHGTPQFATILREMGHDAEHINKGFKADHKRVRKSPLRKIDLGENFELF
ncbi:MAG: hypothetical protein KAT58_01830 [candidate division Zixibacteria bacterium]|nr:hypothetical protein [candidate division Zixibacteria bacterium]